MIDEQKDYQKLVQQANIGTDCASFLTTPLGAYLLKSAEDDEMMALRKLAKADIHNIELLTKLQIEAAVPRRFLQFLNEAITTGKQAQFALTPEN